MVRNGHKVRPEKFDKRMRSWSSSVKVTNSESFHSWSILLVKKVKRLHVTRSICSDMVSSLTASGFGYTHGSDQDILYRKCSLTWTTILHHVEITQKRSLLNPFYICQICEIKLPVYFIWRIFDGNHGNYNQSLANAPFSQNLCFQNHKFYHSSLQMKSRREMHTLPQVPVHQTRPLKTSWDCLSCQNQTRIIRFRNQSAQRKSPRCE